MIFTAESPRLPSKTQTCDLAEFLRSTGPDDLCRRRGPHYDIAKLRGSMKKPCSQTISPLERSREALTSLWRDATISHAWRRMLRMEVQDIDIHSQRLSFMDTEPPSPLTSLGRSSVMLQKTTSAGTRYLALQPDALVRSCTRQALAVQTPDPTGTFTRDDLFHDEMTVCTQCGQSRPATSDGIPASTGKTSSETVLRFRDPFEGYQRSSSRTNSGMLTQRAPDAEDKLDSSPTWNHIEDTGAGRKRSYPSCDPRRPSYSLFPAQVQELAQHDRVSAPRGRMSYQTPQLDQGTFQDRSRTPRRKRAQTSTSTATYRTVSPRRPRTTSISQSENSNRTSPTPSRIDSMHVDDGIDVKGYSCHKTPPLRPIDQTSFRLHERKDSDQSCRNGRVYLDLLEVPPESCPRACSPTKYLEKPLPPVPPMPPMTTTTPVTRSASKRSFNGEQDDDARVGDPSVEQEIPLANRFTPLPPLPSPKVSQRSRTGKRRSTQTKARMEITTTCAGPVTASFP